MTEKVTEKDKAVLKGVEKIAVIVAVQHALSTALAGAVAELIVASTGGATAEELEGMGLFKEGPMVELTSGLSEAFEKVGIDIDALADLIK